MASPKMTHKEFDTLIRQTVTDLYKAVADRFPTYDALALKRLNRVRGELFGLNVQSFHIDNEPTTHEVETSR